MEQKMQIGKLFLFLLAIININSCTSVKNRHDVAYELIDNSQHSVQILQTDPLKLFSSHRVFPNQKNIKITVVIEGDGYSWINRHTVSDDPTPRDPVGLKIATSLKDPVIYLARPCQYIMDAGCNKSIWSSGRFSKPVISSYLSAFDKIKTTYGNKSFDIIGFSGGGFIALVLAAKRHDIEKVTTISGVLDPDKWTEFHDVSALSFSENIDTIFLNSKDVSFHHACSDSDKVVPCSLTHSFIDRTQNSGLKNHHISRYVGASHSSLWKKAQLSVFF